MFGRRGRNEQGKRERWRGTRDEWGKGKRGRGVRIEGEGGMRMGGAAGRDQMRGRQNNICLFEVRWMTRIPHVSFPYLAGVCADTRAGRPGVAVARAEKVQRGAASAQGQLAPSHWPIPAAASPVGGGILLQSCAGSVTRPQPLTLCYSAT
ncbi:unnamed protein product [Closterium sp. NIES-54]